MKKSKKIVGEICLYGGPDAAGYLAIGAHGERYGDGEPVQFRGLTTAMWLGLDDLRKAGCVGLAWVYEPRGQLRAQADLYRPPYYCDLKWEAAPQLVLQLEELLKHAKKIEPYHTKGG